MTNNDGRTRDMTVTGRDGLFHFGTLPPGSYELQIIKDGFALYSRPQVSLEMGRDLAQNATLELGSVNEMVEVMSSDRKAFKPSTPVLRVGANVQQANLITKVNPVYPPSAKAAHVEGAVLLKAVIGKAGVPLSLHVLNSDIDPDLAKAAVEAVSQWRYRPTLLNGDPVEVISNITVNFTLSQ
jgi:TonB family protein